MTGVQTCALPISAYTVLLIEEVLLKLGLKLKNSKIAILGLSYKPNVDDARKSPAVEIINLLKLKGCTPTVFDPWIKKGSNVVSLDEALDKADTVVLATHHKQFLDKLSPDFLKGKKIKAVIDARNVLDKKGIEAKGILYKGIGR